MTRLPPSRTCENRLAWLAAQQHLGTLALAERSGLPEPRLRELMDSPRLLPTPLELQLLCLGLGIGVEALVCYAPDAMPLRDRVAALRGTPAAPVQITVCGGGNLGHVFAGLLSARGDVRVHWLVGSAEKAAQLSSTIAGAGGLTVLRREGNVVGMPHRISANAAEVVPGSQLVLLCLPSFVEPQVLQRLSPVLDEGALVASIPGPGGVQWAAKSILGRAGKRVVFCGLASIPWMCKVQEPGKSVRVLGTKTISGLVAHPWSSTAPALDVMSAVLGLPLVDIQNFLQVILNPSNQLLHPAIMFDLFDGWDGRPLAEPPLFYESVSQRAADLLEAMSGELQALKEAILARRPQFDLSAVMPIDLAILAAYGADIADTTSLRATIATNRSYAGIRTPMVAVDGGLAPNWQSRFFTEDIPYGLVVLRGIADLLGVKTPHIDRVMVWAQECMGGEYLVDGQLTGRDVPRSGAPQAYGILSAAELLDEGPSGSGEAAA